MTIVQIAYEVKDDALARVQAVLDDVATYDTFWNGADFRIERGEFTCLPDNDGDDAGRLFGRIQAAISGETD